MIIESDQLLYENGQYYWTPQRALAAWSRCYQQLTTALATRKYRLLMLLIGIPGSGKSTYAASQDRSDVIIFDGTFVDAMRRARVTAAAHAVGVPVIAVWLDTDFDTCVKRNQQRPADRRVPLDSMNMMLHRLVNSPPQLQEGFSQIYRISA
jgi:predicted kinase